MENITKYKKRFLITIAFGLFYFGDIITTFYILDNGGQEMNKLMAAIGFNGYIIFKTLVMIILASMMYYLEKLEFYWESGIVLGIVFMAGLVATLYNVGFFY